MIVISNPPYNFGNEIISTILPCAKQSIVLMPFNKFKKRNVYKYVDKVVLADKNCFLDKCQDIQPNLLIASLTTKVESRDITDVEKQVWCPEYVDYYLRNLQIPTTFKQAVYYKKDREFVESNLSRILFIPYWPHVGNAITEKSVTLHANRGESDFIEKILQSDRCYCYFVFENSVARDNAFLFWKTKKCDDILRGNLTRATWEKFPHIDWSKPEQNLIV